MKRRSQQGIALVMTLIMLTVIGFLAITFLSMSRRERGSVTTATDQAVARLAADAALARVQMELLAPMLTATNWQLFDLLVSTNYFNPVGFTNASPNPYNVNYDRTWNDQSLDGTSDGRDGLQRVVGNLLFSPRPPVHVRTNQDRTLPMDFRFYLDLNRNGRFDTNGWLPVLSGFAANPWYDVDGNLTAVTNNLLRTNFTGDPEWVGILEHPQMPHSPSNRFVARYAFVAIPAGRTLDINYIHNLAKRLAGTVGNNNEGFYRNQGVGTWEINLAAFLVDLETNVWNPSSASYGYETNRGNSSPGRAYFDAFDILTNRYDGTFINLQPAEQIFSNNAAGLVFNNIDDYSDGQPMLTTTNIDEYGAVLPEVADDPSKPWSGAENPKHFFNLQELYARTNFLPSTPPISDNFADHLAWTGTNESSYGRYTFYRLLSQMGTDTGPESPKLNVNYVNLDAQGRIDSRETAKLIRWTNALQFFTNAADRLIRTYTTNWLREDPTNYLLTFNFTNFLDTAFGDSALGTNVMDMTNTLCLNNIPVWVNNKFVYASSIHRLLQVAANIYDSSAGATNGMEYGIGYPAWPSVFKPIFRKVFVNPPPGGGPGYYNVYIDGYTNVSDGNIVVANPTRDLYRTNDVWDLDPTNNIYGVPLIIGAKKGYPNFNEYAFENSVTLARRLEFQRQNLSLSPDDENNRVAYTNQMYTLACSNVFAVEGWNSYSNVYPRALRLIVSNETTFIFYTTNILTQEKGILQSNQFSQGVVTLYPGTTNFWTNYPMAQGGAIILDGDARKCFQVPLSNGFNLISENVTYIQSLAGFGNHPRSLNIADNPFPTHRWWLGISSRMRYILEDITATPENGPVRPYLVDYVSFNIHPPDIDITSNLTYRATAGQSLAESADPWITNRNSEGIPIGIQNQIDVSWGQKKPIESSVGPTDAEIAGFEFQLFKIKGTNLPGNQRLTNIFQAPYVAEVSLFDNRSLQANDPLVHYTADDLTDLTKSQSIVLKTTKNPVLPNIGWENERYQPWGGNPKNPKPNMDFNFAFKDPGVTRSDSWNFPTDILPNIGWLGRIHRGTPWQTIYLKSGDVGTNWVQDKAWQHWVGNPNGVDAVRMRPAEDWKLFDFFTTAVHENATHGQLSVNQRGLAAWSAVLAGVVAVTNTLEEFVIGETVPETAPRVIEPAYGSPETPVGQIVKAINDVRATNSMFKGTFQHVGEICSVPELTVNSPFLNTNSAGGTDIQRTAGLTEEMYERLPQQIMSLLRLGEPRFVIYAYGQALHPAPRSIVTSGPYFGLCTNYQVTAEVATRAVLRFDGAPKPGDTNSLPRVVVDRFNVLPPD